MAISGKIRWEYAHGRIYAMGLTRPLTCLLAALLYFCLFSEKGFCQSPGAVNESALPLQLPVNNAMYQTPNHMWLDGQIIPSWLLWTMAGIVFIVVLQLVINRLLYVKIKARTREFKIKERQYRELVEGANTVILRWDKEGRIGFVNSFGLDLFGFSKEDIVGRRITDTILPHISSDGKDLSKHIEKIIISPEDFMLNENENVCKDGRRLFIQWSNRPIYDEDGQFLEMLSIGTDISERKRLEADLFQARKMEAIGTLAGGIAHDFNNILSIITGYIEIIDLNLPPDSDMLVFITKIKQASQRAKDLISKILAFSRRTESSMDHVPLSTLVRETMAIIRPTFPSTIKIIQLIENECWIYGDSGQVHQVIMNLCTNAYHAMEIDGGVLTIHLRQERITAGSKISLDEQIPAGDYVCLIVSDSGSGIPKEVIQKIFDPYFTTKEKGKGTGLGLAVVHGVIKDHKGHITVHSEPGKGTTFKIYFPADEDKAAILVKMEAQLPASGGIERLIVVDDETDIVEATTQLLKKYGYTVEGFTRVELALEAFQKNPDQYDLLITDMTMPGMTGARLAQEVLRIKPGFPIILCTGFSEVVKKEAALQSGISEYLHKPVDAPDLLGKVRKLLDRQKQNQAHGGSPADKMTVQ